MAGELIASLTRGDWFRESSVGYEPTFQSVVVPPAAANPESSAGGGNVCGLSLQKSYQTTALGYTYPIQEYYQSIFTIPVNLTLATGVTVQMRLTDDGCNASDLGLVVQIGVTAYNIDSGTPFNVNMLAAGGAEQTGNVTLSATSGVPVSLSIAIANAQLASAAVGNVLLLRLRRVGTAAADTCQGRVVLISTHVKNT